MEKSADEVDKARWALLPASLQLFPLDVRRQINTTWPTWRVIGGDYLRSQAYKVDALPCLSRHTRVRLSLSPHLFLSALDSVFLFFPFHLRSTLKDSSVGYSLCVPAPPHPTPPHLPFLCCTLVLDGTKRRQSSQGLVSPLFV